MLVEDDNNLREIYEARLLAEGYEIVAAHDGEEALALAVKEKPDLIISDVMMPKISGFDMLDILRSTPETKYTKVIMMTALSQAEDKDRADKLGADRYLVKSQVTLEDVAKIAREVLEGTSVGGAATADTTVSTTSQPAVEAAPVAAAPEVITPAPQPVVTPPAPDPVPVVAAPQVIVAEPPVTSVSTVAPSDPAPVATLPVPPVTQATPITTTLGIVEDAQSATAEQAAINEQVKEFVDNTPGTEVVPIPTVPVPDSSANVNGKKVVQPLNDPTVKPDLNQLLADEERKNPPVSSVLTPNIPPGEDPNLIAL